MFTSSARTPCFYFLFLLGALLLCAATTPAHAQLQVKITPGDGTGGDFFGRSVSVSGGYVVAGAPGNGATSGSAYVFRRSGSSWVQEAKLTADDGAQNNFFGISVSVSGDYAVIGAIGAENDNGDFSGAAYVFRRSGSSWVQEAKLTADDGAGGDQFGGSVSISGGYAVIGARWDDDNGDSSGSAYVFRRSGSSWVQEAKLTPGDGTGGDFFGWSVSVSGGYVVAGAPDNGDRSGSAYVFRRSGSSWVQEAKLTADDGAQNNFFGISVSVSGDYAVIGAIGAENDNGDFSGAAYVEPLIASSVLDSRLSEIATSTVGTNFVNVVFRITDAAGRGLNIPTDIVDQDLELFTVSDDGQVVSPTAPETFYQVLKLVQEGIPVPYSLRTVLLLDNSTSVGNDLDEIRDAARTVVDNLVENQEVALYVFDSQVTLLQDFTSDADLLRAAIDGIDIGGPSTALYNGLVEGLGRWDDRFDFTDNGDGTVDIDIERGFLVLLSDGEDTAGGASLSDVINARGDKQVYAVGYGDVNNSVLNQVGNAGVYMVDTAGDLPAVFADVQAEIDNDARSFYILNYSSPRRSNQTWPLEICLRDNMYTGPGACAETTYNSTGFTDPERGVYINRSLENLLGVAEVAVNENGTVLTATTILGLNEPVYEWSSSDESQVTIEAIAGTNQAIATRVGPVGGTATLTVTDTANNLTRSVNANLVVPNEDAATASGFSLAGVYPNPTRGSARVAFEVGAATEVHILLYDVLGRRVLTAHDGLVPAGEHAATLETNALASGVYLLRIEAGETVVTRRLTVVR